MSEVKVGQRVMRPMKEAITRELPNTSTRAGEMLEFQPGNGTRYEVYFQKLSGMISEPLGHGHSATLIVFCNVRNRPSIIIPDHCGYLSLDYFVEKTGMDEGDAVPLVALVSDRLGFNRRTS